MFSCNFVDSENKNSVNISVEFRKYWIFWIVQWSINGEVSLGAAVDVITKQEKGQLG